MAIDFKEGREPIYGDIVQLSPLVQRVLANNPSAFTYTGSGTYIVGGGTDVAVIDPGPDDTPHLEALLRALAGRKVSHILVTHTHIDHSPLARRLQAAIGAKTYGFGPHGSGRKAGLEGEDVEAGADRDFNPDVALKDGDIITGDGWSMEAVHTPGHTSNHMCFALREEETLFTGDHVMGWSTTIVSPPDGDMRAYFASLRKVGARHENIFRPTHGPAIDKPQRFVRALIGHRRQRENQITRCLEDGIGLIPDMVTRMYKDVDPRLHPAAARSVLAHLIHMVDNAQARVEGGHGLEARYALPVQGSTSQKQS